MQLAGVVHGLYGRFTVTEESAVLVLHKDTARTAEYKAFAVDYRQYPATGNEGRIGAMAERGRTHRKLGTLVS